MRINISEILQRALADAPEEATLDAAVARATDQRVATLIRARLDDAAAAFSLSRLAVARMLADAEEPATVELIETPAYHEIPDDVRHALHVAIEQRENAPGAPSIIATSEDELSNDDAQRELDDLRRVHAFRRMIRQGVDPTDTRADADEGRARRTPGAASPMVALILTVVLAVLVVIVINLLYQTAARLRNAQPQVPGEGGRVRITTPAVTGE